MTHPSPIFCEKALMRCRDSPQKAVTNPAGFGATISIGTGGDSRTPPPAKTIALNSYLPGGNGRLARSVKSSIRLVRHFAPSLVGGRGLGGGGVPAIRASR